ncbi:MAG: hypothetical protein IH798_02995, partial [Gemmatimonadetes bacterium]|nr:hypothetical protein [Gemmatimonadota bacterium]
MTAAAAGCGGGDRRPSDGQAIVLDSAAEVGMNSVAESYVQLVLAVGQHDPNYVDAYYGPKQWQDDAEENRLPLGTIRSMALEQLDTLDQDGRPARDELLKLRYDYLTKQLQSLIAHTRMIEGDRLSFDEESKALYDAVAPTHTERAFQGVLDELAQELPGTGSLHDRYAAFREDFVIPTGRVDDVFRAAIAACRERTVQWVDLPEAESFVVEYVKDKPWSGYNWYQGNFQSLIQVNIDFPIYIDRALDLACHEGYPGHHVYNVLLEANLTQERRWMEFSVYALFSPQSLIAEGSANYGIDMTFSRKERLAFEKAHLFPLAGLEPSLAERYYKVEELVEHLDFANNEAARAYVDGVMSKVETIAYLKKYSLLTQQRAEQPPRAPQAGDVRDQRAGRRRN